MKLKHLATQALIASLLPFGANAQKKASIEWYGFVAAQSFFDSHKSTAGAEGFLYLYPDDEQMVNGVDVYELPRASWFGTMARVGFTLKGPEIFGAASRAKAEIEFSGHSQSENHVLYRHAFMALDWDKSSLTLGQTWHPMNDLFPSTVSIAIGSPFNALNRSPQLRYEFYPDDNKNTKLTAAAIFQALNTSVGPDPDNEIKTVKTYDYIRYSMMPMFYLGADFTLGDVKLGAGLEYQHIVPYIDALDGNRKYSLDGLTGMVQAQYAKDRFSVKGKALLGQNMSHLGICSGYGRVASIEREYTPLTALSSWVQVQYGGNLKWGMFGGFMKNLGADKNLVALYVNGGGHIDNMWRIAPNVQYSVGNMVLGCEYELTTVAYGVPEAKGTVTDTHNVSNHRLLLSVMYNF